MNNPTIRKNSEESALQKWQFLFEAELSQVDKVILSRTQSCASLIPQIVGHVISSGGKRLRPVLTILCSKLCDYDGDRHINLAAAIELFHTATLLHDDVVDESSLRRGQPTSNEIWGNAPSILVGDFLLGKAFEMLAQDGSLEVLRLLANTSAIITEGEVKQLMQVSDISTSKEVYLDIISSKTAALFVAACQVGAMVADKPEAQQQALANFGRYLGVAFQIVDDVLDYSSTQGNLGKTIGDDFRESKVTLPVILAYEKSNDQEREFWETAIENGAKNGDLERAIAIIRKYNILAQSIEIAKEYADKAIESIDDFADCDEKVSLIDMMEFAVSRPY